MFHVFTTTVSIFLKSSVLVSSNLKTITWILITHRAFYSLIIIILVFRNLFLTNLHFTSRIMAAHHGMANCLTRLLACWFCRFAISFVWPTWVDSLLDIGVKTSHTGLVVTLFACVAQTITLGILKKNHVSSDSLHLRNMESWSGTVVKRLFHRIRAHLGLFDTRSNVIAQSTYLRWSIA